MGIVSGSSIPELLPKPSRWRQTVNAGIGHRICIDSQAPYRRASRRLQCPMSLRKKRFPERERLRFPATLLMNPVDDIALWRIASDGVAEDLPNAGVIVVVQCLEQLREALLEDVP